MAPEAAFGVPGDWTDRTSLCRYRRNMATSLKIAGGLAAGTLLIGGLAWAGNKPTVTSAATSTITACVAKKGGAVRFVKAGTSCTSKERKTSFNRVGPVGPQGSTGPKGATGPEGAVGPSRTLVTSQQGFVLTDSPLLDVSVLTLGVPAGSYAVDAMATAFRSGTDGLARCSLGADAGTLSTNFNNALIRATKVGELVTS